MANEICSNGYCVCPLFHYNVNGSCKVCPEFQAPCGLERCCDKNYLVCGFDGICVCRNGDPQGCSFSGPTFPMYISASQIALFAALIMGMAALSMVVYRLCTKPRYLSARQRALASQMGFNIENEALSYANYLRASLTSMQIRVLTRLRDRPPTYDNRPNPIALPEAPPPYEGNSEGITLPPPYIEVVTGSTGYTNSTFIDPESNNQNHRSTICPNCDMNQQASIVFSCDKEEKPDATGSEKTGTRDENRIQNT